MVEQEDYFYMLVFGSALIAMAFSLSACGIIKGSKSAVVDKAIKDVEQSYTQDNPIEESVEQKIEDLTGIDIDLSPSTPEGKELSYAGSGGGFPCCKEDSEQEVGYKGGGGHLQEENYVDPNHGGGGGPF